MNTKIIEIGIIGITPLIVMDWRVSLWTRQWTVTWDTPVRSRHDSVMRYVGLAQENGLEVPDYVWSYLNRAKKYRQ